jgi:2-succinyl-5-enolpyruvyl-6-hydroxy-3-cyclohexene-1-carboxylate synthase
MEGPDHARGPGSRRVNDPGLLTAWSRLLLGSLKEAGVSQLVLSPGSRSTPFVAAAVHEGLIIHDVIDERAAAFFALGQARITGRPSLLLCTSGTAGAHYFPALLEAEAAHLPLLVLTADRPFGLIGCGAPQTLDQSHLFGHHVRGHFELGGPDPSPTAFLGLRRVAVQAVALSQGPTPGPVHLNARADKPLEPVEPGPGLAAEVAAIRARPLTRYQAGVVAPDPKAVAELSQLLRKATRPLLALGPQPIGAAQDRPELLRLLEGGGLVTYAEATSQHRACQVGHLLNIVHSVERLDLDPDLVVELGAPPTSTAYAKMLARSRPQRVVVKQHGHSDPQQDATLLIAANPGQVLGQLERPRLSSTFFDRWAEAEVEAAQALSAELKEGAPSELGMVEALLARAPAEAVWVLGNSLAVRHLDLLPGRKSPLLALSQRGVSGIDGLVAGTAGAASLDPRPYLLLLGDVSLLHDLTSLGLLHRPAPTVVVVLNNNGGHIFDQLPIARTSAWPQLAPHFITPHGRSFGPAAQLFGLRYHRVEAPAAFEAALDEAFGGSGPSLIEGVVPEDGAQVLARRLAQRRPQKE